MNLRNLLLVALAGLGVAMAVSVFYDWRVKFEFTIGMVYFAIAAAITAAVFQAIRSQRLPLRTWYVLPFIIGIGFAVLGAYNLRGWFNDLGGALLGTAATFVSFAAFQYWADRNGPRDWVGIIIICAVTAAFMIVGTMNYYSK